MPEQTTRILLVTPVWNDSTRLARFGPKLADVLADCPLAIRWVIADDGSSEEDRTRLKELQKSLAKVFPAVELFFSEEHRGKGSVVREAWSLAPEAAWLVFVDADGSLAPTNLVTLITGAIDADCTVLAIRKRTATTTVVESLWRGLAHRGFLVAAHLLLGLRCEDPQCGAKVLRAEDYRRIAPLLHEDGLAFDSELLTAMMQSGAAWQEVPVTWLEKKGGRVRPLRDAWGMLAALWRVRKRLQAGEFRPRDPSKPQQPA